MNLTVHQCINIQQFRVGAVTNSSVLQIGTAGEIRALSNIYNTGGFTGPAPEFEPQNNSNNPLVPLPAPIEGLYSQTGNTGGELHSNIYQNVSRYLEDIVPKQIERMLPESKLVVGDEYAGVIIEDIRKQLGDRITVYLRQYQTNKESMNPQDVEQSIIKQVKSEIVTAVEQHLLNLQRGKWNSNENDSRQ